MRGKANLSTPHRTITTENTSQLILNHLSLPSSSLISYSVMGQSDSIELCTTVTLIMEKETDNTGLFNRMG